MKPNCVKFYHGEDAKHLAREWWCMGVSCRLHGDDVWVYDPSDELDLHKSILPFLPLPHFNPVGDRAFHNGLLMGYFCGVYENPDTDVGYEFRHRIKDGRVSLIIQGHDWEWDRDTHQWLMHTVTSVTNPPDFDPNL